MVNGPLTLMRLVGRTATGEANYRFGHFWFADKFFWRVLDQVNDSSDNAVLLNYYLKFVLREYTAVCQDWNSFAAIYQLKLPRAASVEVAVGRIAPQPPISSAGATGRPPAADLLVGGDFQYFLDFDTSPELKRWVVGPMPLPSHTGSA